MRCSMMSRCRRSPGWMRSSTRSMRRGSEPSPRRPPPPSRPAVCVQVAYQVLLIGSIYFLGRYEQPRQPVSVQTVVPVQSAGADGTCGQTDSGQRWARKLTYGVLASRPVHRQGLKCRAQALSALAGGPACPAHDPAWVDPVFCGSACRPRPGQALVQLYDIKWPSVRSSSIHVLFTCGEYQWAWAGRIVPSARRRRRVRAKLSLDAGKGAGTMLRSVASVSSRWFR